MGNDSLFSNPPIRRPRKRRAPTSEYRFVRRAKGGAWQARVWLGAHKGGSLNLGLFTIAEWENEDDAEQAAARASREFRLFYKPYLSGHDLRGTMEHLKKMRYARKWVIPADVLPPRVRVSEDGNGYVARVKKGGRVLETSGVFECPWECYEAMCAVLAKEFPRRASKSEMRAATKAEREQKRATKRAAECPVDLFGDRVDAEKLLADERRLKERKKKEGEIKKAMRDGEDADTIEELMEKLESLKTSYCPA